MYLFTFYPVARPCGVWPHRQQNRNRKLAESEPGALAPHEHVPRHHVSARVSTHDEATIDTMSQGATRSSPLHAAALAVTVLLLLQTRTATVEASNNSRQITGSMSSTTRPIYIAGIFDTVAYEWGPDVSAHDFVA
jgi:hypothetical protein